MRVHLSLKSANAKTGPIPVSTTERASTIVGFPAHGSRHRVINVRLAA